MRRTFILLTTLLLPILLFAGCKQGGKSNDGTNGEVLYKTYHNQRYGFAVEYPDNFIAQEESTSGDGMTLATEDGKMELRIYYDQWLSIGDFPTIQQAFKEAKNGTELTYEELKEDYFVLKGVTGDGKLFERWTAKRGDQYVSLYLTYPSDGAGVATENMEHMVQSIVLGAEMEKETAFLYDFIDNCYRGKNFYYELLNEEPELAPFIDPEMDVRRIYSLGTFPYLYSRSESFGFTEDVSTEDIDFETTQLNVPDYKIVEMTASSPCDLNLSPEYRGTLYVQYDAPFPMVVKYIEEQDEIVSDTITTPYPYAPTVALYAPMEYNGSFGLVAFYFVKTPQGWKLALLDESLCSA